MEATTGTHNLSSTPPRPRRVSISVPDMPTRPPARSRPGAVGDLNLEKRRTRSRVQAVRAERDVPNILGSPRRGGPHSRGPPPMNLAGNHDRGNTENAFHNLLNNPAFSSAPMAGKRRMTRSLTRDIRETFAHDELPPMDFEEEMIGMFSSHVASLKAQAAEVDIHDTHDFPKVETFDDDEAYGAPPKKKVKGSQSSAPGHQGLHGALDDAISRVLDHVSAGSGGNLAVATPAHNVASPMIASTANGSGTGSGRVAIEKHEQKITTAPPRNPPPTGNKKADRQKKYFCPHPLCWYETEGFDRKFNLDRHLRSFHKEQWPVSTRPEPPLLLVLGLDPETTVINEDSIQNVYQSLCSTFANVDDPEKMQTFYEARQTLMSLRLPAGQMSYSVLVQTYRMQQSQFEDLEVLIVGSNKQYAAALEDLNSRFDTANRGSWSAKQQREYNKEKESIKKNIYEAREQKVQDFDTKHGYTPKLPRLICSVSNTNKD